MLDFILQTIQKFHYPISKNKDYVEFRQDVTDKYGLIFAVILLATLTWIPIRNYLLARGLWKLHGIHLGAFNGVLDQGITSCGTENRLSRLVSVLLLLVKNIVYAMFLNWSTIFQVAFWFTVFVALSIVDLNGGDLIFLAKRLGQLSTIALPTVTFLTLRPSPLPNTLYLSLLPIHKWLSRVVVLLAIAHTILYMGYFNVKNTWFKLWNRANVYGIVALACFLIITLTSFLRMRDRYYKMFYCCHYICTWTVLLILPLHVRPGSRYTTLCGVVNVLCLLYQIYYRLITSAASSDSTPFRVVNVSPNLQYVEFPNSLIVKKAINPGAHIKITNRSPHMWKRWLKNVVPNFHPYTLVTLPLDRQQALIVRKGAFEWTSSKQYILYGTLDPKLLFIKSANVEGSKFSISRLTVEAKKLLIVIGGSAISFAIPLLRVMNYHGIPAKVIWVVRDYRDIAVLDFFDGFIHGGDFEIFVTGNSAIADGKSSPLKFSKSYGSLATSKILSAADTSSSPWIHDGDAEHTQQELENVDVDLSEVESMESEECQKNATFSLFDLNNGSLQEYSEEDPFLPEEGPLSPVLASRSRSLSVNERFIPDLENMEVDHGHFVQTICKLKLEHHIYKGRPKLNYRYYNWCVNAHDIFTQCSGPTLDEQSNLVCCKDLPSKQGVREVLPEMNKVWVVSAGPKSLVKNVKLWASENNLRYHEEAFYI